MANPCTTITIVAAGTAQWDITNTVVTPSQFHNGDTLTVTGVLKNIGTAAGSTTLCIQVNGACLPSTGMTSNTLQPGGTQNLQFTVVPTGYAANSTISLCITTGV